MTFKYALENKIILNEGLRIGPLKEALLRNQIIKMPKIGWFIPYIATYTPKIKHNKIYTVEEYNSGKLKKSYELDNKFDVIKDAFIDSSKRLEKMGIKSQKINCLIIDIEKNKKQFKNRDIAGESYRGSNTIVVDSLLLYDPENFEDTIVHESAHAIWQNLNKETKTWFIDWYNKNVLSKAVSALGEKLTGDEIEEIWKIFKEQPKTNVQTTINKKIPNIVLKVVDSDPIVVVNAIQQTLKQAFRQNKNIFNDKDAFANALMKVKFGLRGTEDYFQSLQTAKLRSLAYEKGHTPTEYAAVHPEELWAETITEMSKNNTVTRDLKQAIYKVVTGTV